MTVLTQSMAVMIGNRRRTVVTAVDILRLRCRIRSRHDRSARLLWDGLVGDLLHSTGRRL